MCTKTKPKVIVGSDAEGTSGLDWAGIKQTKAPTPAPPSAECKKLRAAFAKGPFGGSKTAASIACKKGISRAAQRSGLEAFWGMREKCPDVCTSEGESKDTDANGDTTVQKICITADDIGQMREQIESMPVYKASGTKTKEHKEGRFAAGPLADVCRMVKTIEAGFTAGSGVHMPGSA